LQDAAMVLLKVYSGCNEIKALSELDGLMMMLLNVDN